MTGDSKKAVRRRRGQSASGQGLPPMRSFEKLMAGPAAGSEDPRERAQALIYEAWDIPHPGRRLSLARKALQIDPDCVDAHALLAREQASTIEEAMALYERAVAGGERTLGPAFFKRHAGHFWELHETRPYMRARLELAKVRWAFGDRSQAVADAKDLLRLNEDDNLGVRYLLMSWLLQERDLPSAKALWSRFGEDHLAHWLWARALMAFIEQGAAEDADAVLRRAVEANPYVAGMLLGRSPLPSVDPSYMTPGERDEAEAYVLENLLLWRSVDGALRWLSRNLPERTGGTTQTRRAR